MWKKFFAGCAVVVVAVVAFGLYQFVGAVTKPETTSRVTTAQPLTPIQATGVAEAPTTEVRHDTVLPSMPKHLEVVRDGESPLVSLDIDPIPLTRNSSGEIVPRTLPGWHGDVPWSVKPGTGVGTTVIVGHAQAGLDLAFNPLTTIDPLAARSSGYHAVVTTETGILTYELTDIPIVGKTVVKNWSELMTNEKDRLLLVTCDLENNRDTYDNRILVLKLIESVSF